MWLAAFRAGTVGPDAARTHAKFLIDARQVGALYLRKIGPSFPPSNGSFLRAAAHSYGQGAAEMARRRDMSFRKPRDLAQAAEIIATGLATERSALASVEQFLRMQRTDLV